MKLKFQQQSLDIYADTSRYNPLVAEKSIRRGLKSQCSREQPSNSMWDNGRDWRKPSKKEGAWIRICPLLTQQTSESVEFGTGCLKAPRYIEKEIKNTVLCVQKFLKTAKEVHRKFGKQGDEKCSDMLQASLELETEIWLPNK